MFSASYILVVKFSAVGNGVIDFCGEVKRGFIVNDKIISISAKSNVFSKICKLY